MSCVQETGADSQSRIQFNLTNAQQYFREHLSVGDYYSHGEKVAGEWFGQGAEKLGLTGKVTEDAFLALCEGKHPVTGRKLGQRMNTVRQSARDEMKANRRIFYDFAIAPPKSVSVVALYQDDRILDLHNRAVRTAMLELQKFAEARVRKGGLRGERITGNLVAATFRHDTSRELDPHLHTHCVVFNATFDREVAPDDRRAVLAREYVASLHRHERALVVAQTWKEVNAMNEAIRAELQTGGRIGSGVALKTYQAVDLNEAQKRDGRFYQPGQFAYVLNRYGRFAKGDLCPIIGTSERGLVLLKDGRRSTMSYRHTHRLAIAVERETNVAPGDRLQLKFNGKSKEGHAIANGELVTVRRIAADGSLTIHSWNGEKWVLPWSHFSAACHQGTGENEQLVLSFANHEVVLDGVRLALLLPAIASFHLDSLRDMPAKFRSQADKSEPFISRVSVRSATDSPEGGAQTS